MKKIKFLLNKLIIQIKENKWIHYGIIIVIGVILSIPMCNIEIRDTHDGALHLLRIIGTNDTLQIGQIPPLINQNYCMGLGYSMNLFYPPLVTYIPLLIKLIVPTFSIALKVFAGLAIIFSGITMYKFVYTVTNKRSIALFASIFYLIAPYKLANVYKRFAIGEFTALAFLPIVFMGLYNLFNQDGKKHYYIAIGAIGLMLSHTVTTLYTAIFCIIYILFNISKLKDKTIIKKCVINVIFILLVSMLFWAPLLEASKSATYAILNDDSMRTTPEYTAQNVINFSQLFTDKQEKNGTTFLIGIPTLIAIALTIFTYKKVDKKYKEFYIIAFLFSLISILMCTKFFPWIVMPNIICKLQYPWRMVGFFNFFISFICGVNLYIILKTILKKDNIRLIISIILVLIMVIDSISIMTRFNSKRPEIDKKYENEILDNRKITHKQINRDYMSIRSLYVQNTYVMERTDTTYVLKGNAEILNENKQNLTDIMDVKNVHKNTILEFPYLYYPGYEITIEKNNGEINKLKVVESEYGYASCEINEDIDEAIIKIQYVGTLVTYISYSISLLTTVIFIIYIYKEKKKGKENV